jgi:hypothetical protein
LGVAAQVVRLGIACNGAVIMRNLHILIYGREWRSTALWDHTCPGKKFRQRTVAGRIVKSIAIWCRGLQRRGKGELMICVKKIGSRGDDLGNSVGMESTTKNDLRDGINWDSRMGRGGMPELEVS